MQQHFFSIRKPLCAFPCFMLLAANLCRIQNIFVRKSMMGSIVSMIIFGDNPQNLGFTNYPVVGKTLAIEKTPFCCIFLHGFSCISWYFPNWNSGFPGFPHSAGFLHQGEFLPEFGERERRDDATADEGTREKPWENQHGTRNAHKKDIKSNPEGLQGLQLRTLTFSI